MTQLLLPSEDGFVQAYELRSLAAADLLPLKLFHQLVFPIAYPASFFQLAVSEPSWVRVGAFDQDGTLVACLVACPRAWESIEVKDRHLLSAKEHYLYIMTLGVLPQMRRHGLGRQLLLHLVQEQRLRYPTVEQAYLHVLESNQPAFTFYRSFGFEYVGVLENYYTIQERVQPAALLCFHFCTNTTSSSSHLRQESQLSWSRWWQQIWHWGWRYLRRRLT
eukprot:m.32164 g.32164  ORF g.32164 m.32164 type:complete len:220 (+) comp12134_c0_seq1:118-777(+)